MNCGRFQDGLYEYVEGSLSVEEQAAADQHLAECSACRHAVQAEKQIAQALSHNLEQMTESIHLDVHVRNRIVEAAHRDERDNAASPVKSPFSFRFAWPVAIVACVIGIVMFGILHWLKRQPGVEPGQSQAGQQASVQMTYVVPTYTFRKEGDRVVDALTFTTNVIQQTLWVEKPAGIGVEKKSPL